MDAWSLCVHVHIWKLFAVLLLLLSLMLRKFYFVLMFSKSGPALMCFRLMSCCWMEWWMQADRVSRSTSNSICGVVWSGDGEECSKWWTLLKILEKFSFLLRPWKTHDGNWNFVLWEWDLFRSFQHLLLRGQFTKFIFMFSTILFVFLGFQINIFFLIQVFVMESSDFFLMNMVFWKGVIWFLGN